jgi:hypothetical protein
LWRWHCLECFKSFGCCLHYFLVICSSSCFTEVRWPSTGE